ncbi:GNAT family N-acetyltransferase, partial [Cupriavidus sp.]|uniref:GNAT family N-acetyltransferase n=1 Tax=Cupriavidus sp. TaxID=1873897 RepID=UPI003D133FD5
HSPKAADEFVGSLVFDSISRVTSPENTATAHASKNWASAQLNLCVNAENTAAKQLYESLGFATFGIEPRAMVVDGRFYDEQHMVLKLR